MRLWRKNMSKKNKKIIAISGGFDPIHIGHVRMIQAAKRYGNVIVFLNTDEWLKRKKGYKFMSWDERAEILLAIKGVKEVYNAMDDDNTVCKAMIRDANTEYELPSIKEIEGEMWKGKADFVNHNEKLVIDLKTTADLTKFKWSASKYNYDSQAYIYSELFGYEMVFIVIDKNTHQLGIFDCSPEFYAKGQDKVQRAVESYRLFYKNDNFDPKQYFINKTL